MSSHRTPGPRVRGTFGLRWYAGTAPLLLQGPAPGPALCEAACFAHGPPAGAVLGGGLRNPQVRILVRRSCSSAGARQFAPSWGGRGAPCTLLFWVPENGAMAWVSGGPSRPLSRAETQRGRRCSRAPPFAPFGSPFGGWDPLTTGSLSRSVWNGPRKRCMAEAVIAGCVGGRVQGRGNEEHPKQHPIPTDFYAI